MGGKSRWNVIVGGLLNTMADAQCIVCEYFYTTDAQCIGYDFLTFLPFFLHLWKQNVNGMLNILD